MEHNAISIKDLKKSFGNVRVLKGINLEVERGTMLALLGPNGAGKTTTIRILSTLLTPDGGAAFVNGFDVAGEPRKVRENIGLTGQYAAVDEYLTGRENLEMMGRLYHLKYSDAMRRAQELLEQFDLVPAGNRKVKTYSGGMRRRLDLGLSLIATPPILFLDEPTTGLDPRSRLAMWDIIQKLVEAEVTILLTTQYLEEADRLADKIAVLDDGKIIAQGTSEELKSRVGKDHLELILKSREDLEKASRALSGKTIQASEVEKKISISIGEVSEIKEILSLLENAGAHIESLTLQKPTLDDVFINLTGHKAEEEKEETQTT